MVSPMVLFRGAGEGKGGYEQDQVTCHDKRVLTRLVDEPGRRHQDNDDVEPEHHGQQLRLQHGKIERSDDDIGKSAQAAGGQGGEDLDQTVAPQLGVEQGLFDLVRAEFPILQTGSVAADALDHEMLVLLGEALCAHGRVRHHDQQHDAVQDRDAAVGQEERLPGLDRLVVAQKTEAVRQEAADDLLTAVHHVPGPGQSMHAFKSTSRRTAKRWPTSKTHEPPALHAGTTCWTE